MPRYYFNIRHPNDDLVPDDEGAEFEDFQTARHEAVESVRDVAIDELRRGNMIRGLSVEIVDESGKVLEAIRAWESIG